MNNNETYKVSNLCISSCLLSVFLITAALLVYFLLPNTATKEQPELLTVADLNEENEEELSLAFQEYYTEVTLPKYGTKVDDGLTLYRQPISRSAVEWFYYQIAGNRDVSQAILVEAEKNNIPLSLAFALAHTESNYNVKAVNRNANNTIDRGLFQLNNNSFTDLTEEDFYDPYVSSKYGMSHLRFCLNTAGNEVSALAMYNAGTSKVRSNRTPQTTLNYVGKIMTYQKMLDELFADQVTAYFEPQITPGLPVAFNKQ